MVAQALSRCEDDIEHGTEQGISLSQTSIYSLGNEADSDDEEDDENSELTSHDIIVDFQKLHCGKGKNNPMDNIGFYHKGQEHKAKFLEEHKHESYYNKLSSFQKKHLRLYCRNLSKGNVAIRAFKQWCAQTRLHYTRSSMAELEPYEGNETEGQGGSNHMTE